MLRCKFALVLAIVFTSGKDSCWIVTRVSGIDPRLRRPVLCVYSSGSASTGLMRSNCLAGATRLIPQSM
jgi:hypothetical protein